MVESGEMQVTAPLKVAWVSVNILWGLGFATLVLALSQVFAYGARLQHEQSLTV